MTPRDQPTGRGARLPLRSDTAVCAAILIITGGFHLYRGVPLEAAVFCVVGLAVAADGVGLLRQPRPRRFRSPGRALSALLCGLGAIGLTALPIGGVAEALALTGIGSVVLVIVWCQPNGLAWRLPGRYRPTAWCWVGVGLALCLSQLIVYLLADPPLHEYAYPNLTVLLEPVVDELPIWRALLTALWLLAGFSLLRWSPIASSGTPDGRP